MKAKLIALAVAAAVSAPAMAATDISLHGDARARYNNKSYNDAAATASAFDSGGNKYNANTNSRIRLGFTAKTDGGVSVDGRMKVSDGTHGSSPAAATDYGYMTVPVGPVKVSGGVMVGNWGNKLRYWDTRPNRVLLAMPMGDWTGMLAFDKITENGGTATSKDNDNSSTKIMLKGKTPIGEVGLMYNMQENNTGTDVTGSEVDLYLKGGLPGDIMLLAEYNTQGGDANRKDIDADGATTEYAQPSALYLHLIKQFGAIDGHFAYATANNGFAADDHFAPFSVVGTSQDTAVMDFGSTSKNMNIMAIIVGGNVADSTRLQAGYGVIGGKYKYAGAESNISGSAMDLQAHYSVTKATVIKATYGTVSYKVGSGSSMSATSYGINMETKF